MRIFLFTKKTFVWVGIFSLAFSVLPIFTQSTFVEGADSQKDLEKKQDKLEEKKASYENIISIKQKQATALDNQINSLESRSKNLEKDISKNSEKIDRIGVEVGSLKEQIEKKDVIMDGQRKLLAGFLQTYYDAKERKNVSSFLSGSHAGEIFRNFDANAQIQNKVGDVLDGVITLREQLDKERGSLVNKKTEQETAKVALEKQTVYLASAKQQKESLLKTTKKEESKYGRKLSRVEEDLKEIEEEIEAIESQKAGLLDFSSIPSFGSGVLKYPVKNVRITQHYGKATWTRYYNFHNGMDFGGSTGTSIYSAEDGKVIATGDSGRYAYGKWIVIEHDIKGKTLITLYGHLSKQSVKKGDKVDRGEKIGKMGNTGYSTGPHLHFSVFQKNGFEIIDSSKVSGVKIPTGAHVNPRKYL